MGGIACESLVYRSKLWAPTRLSASFRIMSPLFKFPTQDMQMFLGGIGHKYFSVGHQKKSAQAAFPSARNDRDPTKKDVFGDRQKKMCDRQKKTVENFLLGVFRGSRYKSLNEKSHEILRKQDLYRPNSGSRRENDYTKIILNW